jgi:hypothetical protein
MLPARLLIMLSIAVWSAPGCATINEDNAPFALWQLIDDDDDDDVVDDDDSGPDDDDSTVGDDDDATAVCDDSFLALSETPVSFSGELLPMFEANCQPCHITQTRGLMSLTEFEAYAQLVGILNNLQYQGLNRVEAGDPEASYLLHKVMPCDPSDETWGYQQGPMPPPFPGVKSLTEEQINLIYSWISQGAEDN